MMLAIVYHFKLITASLPSFSSIQHLVAGTLYSCHFSQRVSGYLGRGLGGGGHGGNCVHIKKKENF